MNFRFFIKIAAILHFFGFRPQVTMLKNRHIGFRRKVMILKNLPLSLFCLETKKHIKIVAFGRLFGKS